MIRCQLNTSQDLEHMDKQEILEDFAKKLRKSRYSLDQVRDIIQSGIVGYKNKWERKGKLSKPGG